MHDTKICGESRHFISYEDLIDKPEKICVAPIGCVRIQILGKKVCFERSTSTSPPSRKMMNVLFATDFACTASARLDVAAPRVALCRGGEHAVVGKHHPRRPEIHVTSVTIQPYVLHRQTLWSV